MNTIIRQVLWKGGYSSHPLNKLKTVISIRKSVWESTGQTVENTIETADLCMRVDLIRTVRNLNNE
jgi:hypothetical protein